MMNSNLQHKTVTAGQAIAILQRGGVGVIPTDTLYGLSACADNRAAVSRLYALKRRERKPGTIIASSTDQIVALGVDAKYVARVADVWPGPVSVETPLGPELSYLHQDMGRQGFRVVSDETVRAILSQTGPLLTSSANQPGEPVAESLEQAWNYFGDTADFYLDGGDLSGRLPSTLIAINADGKIDIIREGAVGAAELRTLYQSDSLHR